MVGTDRASVFIDGQNVYNDARRAFHLRTDPALCGQIQPWALGELLVAKGNANAGQRPRELQEVCIYKGLPSSKREPKAYGATRRQEAGWIASGPTPESVKPFLRSLRYPDDWPNSKAEEKGVDVALAVDLVYHGLKKNYDLAIVCSTDTDLVPALEAICDQTRAWGWPRLEVMSWTGPFPDPANEPTKKRLRVEGHPFWCHWLDEADYRSVQDLTDYNIAPKA